MASGELSNPGFAPVLDRNVRALQDRRRVADRRKGWQERVADAITRFTGSMTFVYLHLALFGAWILWNAPLFDHRFRFDPQFVVLAMAASVEAIFLSTFILISQNRMQAMADQRADLDLQVNLLAEHELTRLIRLVRRMAERMGVDEAEDPDLPHLEKDVQPEQVLEHIENVARAGDADERRDG